MAKKKYNVIREEMLQVASNVAQEKNIDQDSVFSAMEQALEKAARVKYGQEIDIRISIDRSTGDIKLNSYLEVVENIEEEFQSRQILLEDAKKTNQDIGLGEFITKELPPIELGRFAAQNSKGVIIQKVREADKSKHISDLEEEIGDVLFSVVNLARHLKLDSEDLLRRANSKFINRFKAIEKELVKRGKTIDDAKLDEMDEIWDKIKN